MHKWLCIGFVHPFLVIDWWFSPSETACFCSLWSIVVSFTWNTLLLWCMLWSRIQEDKSGNSGDWGGTGSCCNAFLHNSLEPLLKLNDFDVWEIFRFLYERMKLHDTIWWSVIQYVRNKPQTWEGNQEENDQEPRLMHPSAKQRYCSHQDIDYCSTTTHAEVLYFSYTSAVVIEHRHVDNLYLL